MTRLHFDAFRDSTISFRHVLHHASLATYRTCPTRLHTPLVPLSHRNLYPPSHCTRCYTTPIRTSLDTTIQLGHPRDFRGITEFPITLCLHVIDSSLPFYLDTFHLPLILECWALMCFSSHLTLYPTHIYFYFVHQETCNVVTSSN